TDNSGSFSSVCADKIKSLYFPLGNENLMSSISPDLHGDIKSGQNAFLLAPVSRIDLVNSRASRNFWVNKGDGSLGRTVPFSSVWSATGVSKNLKQIKQDKFALEAGMLWQKITRQNNNIGLKAEILSFVPATGEPVEIMQVKLTNISNKQINFIPTAAIPMYARGANNIRDHRHVTSLLQRVTKHKFGVISKPTLVFDEAGHRPNKDNYFVLGWDEKFKPPQRIYPTQEIFCSDSGDLEAPEAVFKNIPEQLNNIQGKEPMAGLSFKAVSLKPKQSKTYTLIMGIAQNSPQITRIIAKFNHPDKLTDALRKTKNFWNKVSRGTNITTGNKVFDNWLRWVNIQPELRKIFGCSFLPDFDYGKGGRGWRDLWQDCLGLIFNDPQKIRSLLVNNFCGVKIDGSNATIIANAPGEFIADRNNISRVWMDHGIWPLLTLDLYINETGDRGILFEQATYFCNHEIKRSKEINYSWTCAYGNKLRAKSGRIYSGSILEHLLAQNLVQFLNVGSHNHIRLEGADWNDGLDMAQESGESVAFSAMYAQNLETLCGLLLKAGKKKIALAEEIKILLAKINYESIPAKHKLLERYFSKTSAGICGRKVHLDAAELAKGLKAKSTWIKEHIRNTEWLKEGFFNGYYDNRKQRLEGVKGGRVQMTLTGQAFPIMAGIARDWQVRKILQSVNKYLVDKQTNGIHLNTDFKRELHDLGRAFSFSYGEKENGAIFSHMVVMFAYALYKQGYAAAGWEALSSLYKMAIDTPRSKIYPCLPEYFNLQGRGMYAYLTGSASWFSLTMLTQVFGIKGRDGDLMIEPKLSAEHFRQSSSISSERTFAGRRIKIKFFNFARLDFGKYRITKVLLNSENLPIDKSRYLVITREVILGLPAHKLNLIDIHLAS
ncbi:MAG: cellobiose phosphorylase, partial [Candidatus Omnitrophota bacterium]|nr:cellobiose phosphorylase [Candidatus Omnitrophota bacterium]